MEGLELESRATHLMRLISLSSSVLSGSKLDSSGRAKMLESMVEKLRNVNYLENLDLPGYLEITSALAAGDLRDLLLAEGLVGQSND